MIDRAASRSGHASTVTLTHDYAAPPDAVWRVATGWETYERSMRGIARIDGLPTVPLHRGQVVRARMSLFGILPWMDWTMRVVEHDPARLIARSEEHGAGIPRWAHAIRVEPHAGGARLTDEIEIEAGWRTPLVVAWARHVYRRRHAPRVAMLREGANGPGAVPA